ncbi:MAG TPA: hypothetical protein VEF04_05620 [Blastocatellia bacterium]|nr:hypothetical protein [Blastocatellia bacterium]
MICYQGRNLTTVSTGAAEASFVRFLSVLFGGLVSPGISWNYRLPAI